MSRPAPPASGSAQPDAGLAPGGAATWRYRPELDGLRSFAVLIIVFFHAQVSGASSSFIVLDLFFVLSGFLVTNVVLQEIANHGRLRVGRYFARRVRRLLPAAVVTILVTSVVFVLVASQPQRAELVRHAQAALVYLANWQFIADGADYFAGDIRDSPFMHFWSLSVEEQYYIAFPLLILLWHRFAPGRLRVLLGMLSAGIALSLTSQLYYGVTDPTRAYFGTDARLFQLLAGAAVAVALREFARPAKGGGVHWPRAGRALALGGVIGYVVFGTELVAMSVSHRNVLATFLAGALVVGVYVAADSWVARGFALPWMTRIGQISYGIYLWHWPIVVVLEQVLDVRPVVIAVMAIVLAVAMASLSHDFLEEPIRRGEFLNRYHWQTATTGLTASVVVATLVVQPILTSDRQPVVATASSVTATTVAQEAPGRSSAKQLRRELRRPVPQDLDYDAIAKDRGKYPKTCGPGNPEDCLVVDGDGAHVVLVGDSHARALSTAFATLAEEKGFRLSTNIVSACPWADNVSNRRSSPANRKSCLETRRDFYRETLPAMDADVVVLSDFPRTDRDTWRRAITDYDGNRPPADQFDTFWRDAVARTVRLIDRAGANALMVTPMMGTGGWQVEGPDPLDCLARAKTRGDCVVTPPPDRPLIESFYRYAAVGNDAAWTVDFNPIICPDHPTCRPLIGGEVVWRNSDHVAAGYFKARRNDLWRAMKDSGAL